MVWVKNLISYNNTGNAGKCPKCKSEHIKVEKYKRSLTFKCESCGNTGHFDGVVAKEE